MPTASLTLFLLLTAFAFARSEVIDATNGNLEAARKLAGHSDVRTTQGYSREQLKANRQTAAIVAEFRLKNGA